MAAALSPRVELIDGQVVPRLDPTVGPAHFEDIDLGD
jgi:hypothetical protein